MAETLQGGQTLNTVRPQTLVRAAQVAREAEIRQSTNGVRWATFGETGVPVPDLDRMLEAVPSAIVESLKANTYYFVPLAMREPESASPDVVAAQEAAQDSATNEANAHEANAHEASANAASTQDDASPDLPARRRSAAASEAAMVAPAYTDEFSDGAICHRNVELGSGHRGVFISTRLMDDRFALSFEFFINVAHALSDVAGVPERFAELAWKQALDNVRGETSFDAWEGRNLALGRPADFHAEVPAAPQRRNRSYLAMARPFSAPLQAVAAGQPVIDEKERLAYLEAAFSDAVAIYLLSLALDFDYSELREREYPLLAPTALAARLRLVAELYPPNAGYDFAVRYKRRA